MKESDIHKIIAEVVSGNTREFAKLIDEYKQMVYSLCMKMVQNIEEAEEITQDTFVKAYKGLSKFKQKSKFSTWLYQITYFTAVNHLRKKKHEVDDKYLEIDQHAEEEVPNSLEQEDKRRLILEGMKHLNPKERAVINLFYLEEMDTNEVADITKMNVSNVKVSLHRARKKLYVIMNKMLKNELNSLVNES